MLNVNLTLFLFFAAVPSLLAQKITHYGIKEGLKDENIVYVIQDDEGILWMASNHGNISSYNGWEFINLDTHGAAGIAQGKTIKISKGKVGIRITTSNGIVTLNDGKASTLYQGGVRSVIELTDRILFIDDQRRLKNLSLPNAVETTIMERVKSVAYVNGNILVLTESNKLFRLTGGSSNQLLHDFESAPTFEFHDYGILVGKETMMVASRQAILQIPGDINFNKIQQIIEESLEKIWLLVDGDLLKVEFGKTVKYSRAHGFTDGLVEYIFKDFEDNIWAGTIDGLFKIQQNKFQLIGEVESTDRITTISNGWMDQIWVGSERGKLFFTSDGALVKDNSFEKVLRESINSAAYDNSKNNLLVTTDHNWLLALHANRSYNRYINRNAINSNMAFQIFSDNKDFWIASINRIFRVPDALVKEFLELTSTINNHSILAVCSQPDDSIVILTTESFYVVTKEGSIKTAIELKELKDKIFTSFEVDKMGRFWIGTWGHGIIRMDQKKYASISRMEGLNSDIVLNLLSVNNSIYVGTQHGIDKIEFVGDSQWEIKHLIDDITPTNPNTFYLESRSNTLWFGSGSKCYNYRLDTEFKKPGNVSVTKAIFFGRHLTDTVLSTTKVENPFRLQHKQNTVEFHFLGVSLSYPEAVTYRTRLIGRDSTWTYPIKERFVRYGALPPGNYKFEVMAYSPEGILGNSTATVDFTISNPLWMEPWVIVGLLAILISSGWFTIRVRERNKLSEIINKEKKKAEITDLIRKDIARDFHDNIGNKLAGLKLASNLIRMKLKDDNKEVSNLLHDIEKDSQDLFDGTRDFIWSIDPESDNLLEVFSYIKDFGEKTFERSTFTFLSSQKINTDSIIKIPTGWSRQMVMIFKEAMTNSIKHSKGNTIEFLLLIEDDHYKFLYTDNGGYDGSKNFTGRGMKNMTDRANSIGGHLDFTVGVAFQISLKLYLGK